MQVKFGGFAAFCITCVVVCGVVSCVEAICNRPTKAKEDKKTEE